MTLSIYIYIICMHRCEYNICACQPVWVTVSVCVFVCVCARAYVYIGKMSLILLTDANHSLHMYLPVIPLIHGWTNAGIYTRKLDYISTCACMARWHNGYIIITSF